jgi:drug/metabolite transporter (DMT)-like permease
LLAGAGQGRGQTEIGLVKHLRGRPPLSASLYLVPVFGILIAAAFLGERLTPVAFAGTAVVLLSTIIIMKWDKSAV